MFILEAQQGYHMLKYYEPADAMLEILKDWGK